MCTNYNIYRNIITIYTLILEYTIYTLNELNANKFFFN